MAAVAAEVNLDKLKPILLQAFSKETACEIDFVIRQLRTFTSNWSFRKSPKQLQDVRNLLERIQNISKLLVDKKNKYPKLNPLIVELDDLQKNFEQLIKRTSFGNTRKRKRPPGLRF